MVVGGFKTGHIEHHIPIGMYFYQVEKSGRFVNCHRNDYCSSKRIGEQSYAKKKPNNSSYIAIFQLFIFLLGKIKIYCNEKENMFKKI